MFHKKRGHESNFRHWMEPVGFLLEQNTMRLVL